MSSVAAVLGISRHRLDTLRRQRGHCRICCTPFDLDEVEYSGRALVGRTTESAGLDCQFCHIMRPVPPDDYYNLTQVVQAHRGEVQEVAEHLREAGLRLAATRVDDFLADPRAYDFVLKRRKTLALPPPAPSPAPAPSVMPETLDPEAEREAISPGTVSVQHMPMVLGEDGVRLLPLNLPSRSVWGVLHDDARAICNKYEDHVVIEPGIEIVTALYRGFYSHAGNTFTFLPQREWRKIRKWPRPDVQAVIDNPHHIHWTSLRFEGETVCLLSYSREDGEYQSRRIAMTWVYATDPEAPNTILDAIVEHESLPYALFLLARELSLTPQDDEPTLNQIEEEPA